MQLGQLNVTIKGLFLAFGVAGLVSCGSGDESGGGGACGGADETGICLFVASLVPFDVDEGPDLDVVQDICTPAVPPALAVFEDFVIARAEPTFGASQIGPLLTSATQIIITGYTISYAAIPPPAFFAPPITAVQFTGNVTTIPVNGTATANVDLLTFDQKEIYRLAAIALNGVLPDSITYSATYTFFGETDIGEPVSVTASTFFDLANFNNC
jgi:hypothetical protein